MMKRLYNTPLGQMVAVAGSGALKGLYFVNQHNKPTFINEVLESTSPILEKLGTQLEEYFEGRRHSFSLDMCATGTPFQRASWAVLQTIPYGTTITYKNQAQAMNHPKAARACGQANGRNPFSIIVPCHRVVGTGQKMGGYAGDPQRKKWLLHHEATFKTGQ